MHKKIYRLIDHRAPNEPTDYLTLGKGWFAVGERISASRRISGMPLSMVNKPGNLTADLDFSSWVCIEIRIAFVRMAFLNCIEKIKCLF
ncbi:MAG: hypothetical protein H6974_13825 [Gammaproteobacteria bacterium]|nr:hypothetical protein [Gammaproteobacteria bacterium]MCP5197843.1 hypothetical protein [Gammaproteobacteria bacterium]